MRALLIAMAALLLVAVHHAHAMPSLDDLDLANDDSDYDGSHALADLFDEDADSEEDDNDDDDTDALLARIADSDSAMATLGKDRNNWWFSPRKFLEKLSSGVRRLMKLDEKLGLCRRINRFCPRSRRGSRYCKSLKAACKAKKTIQKYSG